MNSLTTSVSQNIHPKDEMYSGKNKVHYFSVGVSAMSAVNAALIMANKNPDEIENILDFPCGYGRVMRHLKASFPKAAITGVEIEQRYLDYVEKEFNAETLLSYKDFTKINFRKKYDLIWCGSLFTHLSKAKYIELLDVFTQVLEDRGVLVFSTHGRFSPQPLSKGVYGLHRKGKIIVEYGYKFFNYGYADYRSSPGYGISIVKPSWVVKQIEKRPGIKMIMYSEKLWDNHQDVVACIKEPII